MSKKRTWLLPGLLACALLTSACARAYILEDLGMILGVGFDLADDGKLLQTVVMPSLSQGKGPSVIAITSKGDLVKEARENISMSSDRQVVSGQMRTAIFSEKLARHGIWSTLDTLLRDVNITKSLFLCISDGDTREILKRDYPTRPSSGRYLYELFKKEARNYTVPRTTIQKFDRDFHEIGTDPYVPYIRLQGELIAASGTALFRDDKFVGSISPEETKMMLLLRGTGEGGDIKQSLSERTESRIGQPAQMMLTFVRTKHDLQIDQKQGKPLLTYTVEVEGQVIEYTGLAPLSADTLPSISKQLEKGLESRMRDLIDHLQHKYKVDPLGIGTHLRATGRFGKWDRAKWRKLYEEAEIKVNFHMRIVRTGLTR